MKKPLRIVAWTLGSVVGLLVLAFVVLVLAFDPNNFKDKLVIQPVKAATGRDLTIAGQLSWSIFPWLGVKAEGLTLSNARGFGPQPFAKIGAAGVSVELLPLLVGKLRVGVVHVHDVTLNLARDASGYSNWDDLTPRSKTPPASKPTAEEKAPPEKSDAGASLAAFAIGGIDLQHATLNFRDGAQNTAYAVRDLELRTGRISANAPIDIRLACTLEYGNPAQQAHLAVKAALALAEKALAVRDFDLTLDDSRLTGELEIVDLQKSAVRFDLALDRLDLDRYWPSANPGTGATTGAKKTPAPGPAASLPLGPLRALDAAGKLRIGKLKIFGLRADEVVVQIAAHKGVIALGPNEAKLYGGVYRGRTTLDASSATPRLTMDQQLTAVRLGPLLKDAGVFNRYSGTGEVALKLAAQGASVAQIKQTLSGTANVSLRDGKVAGVNLSKLVTQARQLYDKARGQSVVVAPEASDETAFTSLHASVTIANGVARTDDLRLDGPVVRGNGKGKTDLANETLDYRLMVTVAEGEAQRGTTLPLRVGGTYAEPSYRVEFEEIIKQQAEEKVKQELERLLRKRNP